ncbi:hypothetical protein [Micromonospora chokoriensis]|uniref:hypothetical protein n=1 Tax=Micromonospora chokoriensis TaxID=356851 RepID=UPI000A536B8B|nr:hypothetical protein [Micromonospora chokoriensis]
MGVLMVSGCSRPADTVERTAEARSSSSPAVAMRLDKPEKLLSGWPESMSRKLREQAQQTLGGFKALLDGEPTSAVGTAYATPDGQYTALASGVSGKVTNPKATMDEVFAALPRLSDVKPTPPGPMGGEARCGKGETQGVNVDVCAWADRHSIGMVAFIGFPKSGDPDSLFVQARSQLEHPVT